MLIPLVLIVLNNCVNVKAEQTQMVLMTEVFKRDLNPAMFNWSWSVDDQYDYFVSLQGYPDLPSWIHYVYSEKHQAGYIYGVPPNENKAVYPIEIVALNRKTYKTKMEVLNIMILEKLNPAKYELEMKIDFVNVDDMFHGDALDALQKIYKRDLWTDSENDLYVTFLNSAVQMGARKPLDPNAGEGVIIRLGSEAPFSTELLDLQAEVKPLYILPTCPRKKTSVERFFRKAGFEVDWCSFKLIHKEEDDKDVPEREEEEEAEENEWKPVSRTNLPRRSYWADLVFSLAIPMIIFTVLVVTLSIIFCVQQDDSEDEEYFANLFHICTDCYHERHGKSEVAVDCLNGQPAPSGGVSNTQEISLSPEPVLLSRSQTASPSSTLNRGMHCRPSPPPYVKPKLMTQF